MPFLNVDGTNLYFNVRGKGISLVFIHPPLLTSVNFEYQIKTLSQYFQIITFDIRGHGKSQYSREPISYSLIVEDIKQLLDHLNVKKAFICGYSTGGSIVLEFLLTAAERALGGIIISGMSEVRDLSLKKRISLGITFAKSGVIPVLSWPICWSNSDTLKLFKKMVSSASKSNAQNIEQYYHYSLNYNCTNQLKNIHFPVLLVYGKKDKAFHSYALLLHDHLPDNELLFIENANHRIPTKAADELNAIIQQFIQF